MTTTIAPLAPQRANWFVRLFYWFCRRRLGRVPASIGVAAHHTGVLRAYGFFEGAIERCTALDKELKALANLRAAMVVGCRFCIDIGSAHALESGLDEACLRDLVDWRASSRFTQVQRDVLGLCDGMSGAPAIIEPAVIHRLDDALGRKGLVELASIIAWENYRARFNHAFGAKEEGFSPTFCMLPSHEAA